MNNDISIMIEIQGHWDIILKERKLIDKQNKSIKISEEKNQKLNETIDSNEKQIKELKTRIKQNERELAEYEEKLKNLRERKESVRNEKELQAVTHEMKNVQLEVDDFEEKIILSMDSLDSFTEKLQSLKEEYETQEREFTVQKNKFLKREQEANKLIKTNNAEVEEKVTALSSPFRSKFSKLLQSQNGVAIARVEKEICGACNFKIPASIAQEAGNDSTVTVCTNCGRFIYA